MLKVIDSKEYIIYRHTSPFGKVYIGQTNQKLKDRFRDGEGYKSSKKFYNNIRKYGWDNFTHEVLFEGLNKVSADCIETDLIYYYKSLGISLNIANGGEGRTRNFESEETKQKIHDTMLGKNSAPVLLYNTEGVFIQEFKSVGDCAKYLNVAWVTVSKHLQRKTKTIHRKYIIYRKHD